MSSIQDPTYLLAPNWTFRPYGRIALSNIVVDPLRPYRPVIKANPNKPLPTDKPTEKNWKLSLEAATNFHASLWAKFVENINALSGVHRKHFRNGHFAMEKLVTVTLKNESWPRIVAWD
jgi:hypothetical protein